MALRFLLATGNAHKVAEIAAILGDEFELSAHEPGVDETGSTFLENALLKARAVVSSTGRPALADDSGIEIDALDGGPGVHSARWVPEDRWLSEVLRRLSGLPPSERGCRYVCAAVAAWPDGSSAAAEGSVDGVIASAPRGSGGFGYDPLVLPVEGDGRTFAELSPAEKHAISHRARAFRALRPALRAGPPPC